MVSCWKNLVVVALVMLGTTSPIGHAAVADWSEEMTGDVADAATRWNNTSGVTGTNGNTWTIDSDILLGYKNRHPFSVGEPLASNTYTYEFKAKLLEPINPEVVPAWPIGVYSSDNVNRLNRSGAYYGRWAADNQIFLDKTGPSINGDNYMFGDVISPLVVGEWAVFRVVQDVAANTTKIWINSVLQLTAPSGAEGAEDDPLSFGGHNGGDTLVEWDYLRFVRGVLDIAEPLNAPGGGGCAGNLNGDGTTDGADVAIIYNAWGTNDATADIDDSGTVDGADLAQVFNCWGQADTSPAAVPEPASFGLLGLGLLGLLTRARR